MTTTTTTTTAVKGIFVPRGDQLFAVTFRIAGRRGTRTWEQFHPTAERAAEQVAIAATNANWGAAITIISAVAV